MAGKYFMERGWQDHDIFRGDAYSRRDAWEWLIANAAWKETRINVKGSPLKLQRGQLSYSLRYLSDVWMWSKSSTQRYIETLRKWGMIDTATDTGRLVITICNYERFQSKQDSERYDDDTATDTATDTIVIQQPIQSRYDAGTNKNKENNIINNNIIVEPAPPQYTPEFELFWDAYPRHRRREKPEAFKIWEKAIKKVNYEKIIEAVKDYAQTEDVIKGYSCYPAKWLKNERWCEDFFPPPKPKPKADKGLLLV